MTRPPIARLIPALSMGHLLACHGDEGAINIIASDGSPQHERCASILVAADLNAKQMGIEAKCLAGTTFTVKDEKVHVGWASNPCADGEKLETWRRRIEESLPTTTDDDYACRM